MTRTRTVLITGAGRNIGRFLAESFAADGQRVAVNATSECSLTEVSEALRESGAEFVACPGDVREPEQVREIVAQEMAKQAPRRIEIKDAKGAVRQIKGRTHKAFPALLAMLGAGVHVWLVFPRLRDHHHDRVREGAARKGQQFNHFVKRRRV
jgi:NAD(P)-dependent dehydrogenase (short-subunit alcohol dehydrogenase family)